MLVQPDKPLARGLTETEAQMRLAEEGFNDLPGGKQRNAFGLLIDVLRKPMLLLMLTAGGIYLLLGDMTDALVLLSLAGLADVIAVVSSTAKTARLKSVMPHIPSTRFSIMPTP